jgi:hypothetical protein
MNLADYLAHEKDKTIVLPPRLFAPVSYYATLAEYQHAVIDLYMPYNKRDKDVHRYTIVDARDNLQLTVPLAKPHSRLTWNDVEISEHNSWWNNHRNALESAYGRTPFFEFYIGRFLPYLTADISLGEMIRKTDERIRAILSLKTAVEYQPSTDEPIVDSRYLKMRETTCFEPYYQVRQQQLGFRPDLSILDLIFNMGPEAAVILARQIKRRHE